MRSVSQGVLWDLVGASWDLSTPFGWLLSQGPPLLPPNPPAPNSEPDQHVWQPRRLDVSDDVGKPGMPAHLTLASSKNDQLPRSTRLDLAIKPPGRAMQQHLGNNRNAFRALDKPTRLPPNGLCLLLAMSISSRSELPFMKAGTLHHANSQCENNAQIDVVHRFKSARECGVDPHLPNQMTCTMPSGS